MEKSVNIRIKEIKDDMVKVINDSNLPISIIVMILESVMASAKDTERIILDKEIIHYTEQSQPKETEMEKEI